VVVLTVCHSSLAPAARPRAGPPAPPPAGPRPPAPLRHTCMAPGVSRSRRNDRRGRPPQLAVLGGRSQSVRSRMQQPVGRRGQEAQAREHTRDTGGRRRRGHTQEAARPLRSTGIRDPAHPPTHTRGRERAHRGRPAFGSARRRSARRHAPPSWRRPRTCGAQHATEDRAGKVRQKARAAGVRGARTSGP
jgi:hypothetical protein